jgi:hypothetical protein
MYASNIQILSKKPCLSIDICGGNEVANCTIRVYALAKRTRQIQQLDKTNMYKWDKSPLYSGRGISAIVRVAAGLLAALPYYPIVLSDFGERLASVVGLVDKATGQYRESYWTGNLKVGVLASILERLAALHELGLVHGDIRLVNLLSSGHIVDFDFVGLERYPEGLKLLTKDGERHPNVASAISNENVHEIKPQIEHDLYSMAKVLSLFIPKTVWWEETTIYVQDGQLQDAIRLLRKHKGDIVSLDNSTSSFRARYIQP